MGDKRRLLLVEDDDDGREALKLLLEHQGYIVNAAKHGQEALQILHEQGPPCLMILDLMMPVMSGWELRLEMRREEALASVPVVIVSGVAQMKHAVQLDALACFKKPVSLEHLYEILEEHC